MLADSLALPPTASRSQPSATSFIALNGVAVSALYWAQAVVLSARGEFGASPLLSLLPGAALAGYAAGVALLAARARDLSSPRGLALHAGGLAGGLGMAALAPTAAVCAAAALVIGLGCSLTQRLLACATAAAGPARQAQSIASVIAAGLTGIVLARTLVPLACGAIGWRALFGVAALVAAAGGLAAARAAVRLGERRGLAHRAGPPSALSLWRARAPLRAAALQQATVFAAFNAAWSVFPHRVALAIGSPALLLGGIASLGALAALLTGRLCTRFGASRVATVGLATVACAGLGLLLTRPASPLGSVEMALLDVGTQVALVANQARAQANEAAAATRGRLAAIVTTIGFAGGAAGAALANLLA